LAAASSACYDGFEAIGLERLDRRFRGAGGRGDPAAQFSGIDVAGHGHASGAQGGLQGQLVRRFHAQAEFSPAAVMASISRKKTPGRCRKQR
jgi:hypothetical protein